MAFEKLTLGGFSVERLRAFCVVVESEGSLIRAAQGDPTRQSQFSRQLKELEGFIGTPLFRRDGRTFRLTETGRELAVITNTYFLAVEDLKSSITGKREPIRIGAGESVFHWIVFPRLDEIRNVCPRVDFFCENLRTNEIHARLKAGRLDLGILRDDSWSGIEKLPLAKIRYQLAVPRIHLRKKTPESFSVIHEIPMVSLSGQGQLNEGIAHLAEKNDVALNIVLRADSFSMLLEAMIHGSLAAFLPETAAKRLSDEHFAKIELKELRPLDRELVLAHTPKSAEIRQSIRRTAERIAGIFKAGKS